MPITSLGGAVGGGGGMPTLPSSGIVTYHKGQWSTVELDGVYPMLIDNPEGLRGHPLFQVQTSIGERRDIDLATTGYKGIQMRAYMYSLRRILIGLATNVPVGCKISIWTDRDGAGDKLADLSAADLATMTDWKAAKTFDLAATARLAEWLYVNVEVASSVPAAISLWAFGEVMIQNDLKGQPF